jgi:glycosyltransferase involved in cell wall biosynthesis
MVPFLRIFTSKPIVLDAGWPLLDGYKIKGSKTRDSLNRIKIWWLDFISFHSSDLVFFESNAQEKYSKRRYLIPKYKIAVSYTGFDETQVASFTKDDNSLTGRKLKTRYVLFRGKVNAEAGLQNIINAFSDYEVDAPLVILTNRDLKLTIDKERIRVIQGYVSPEEMSDLYKGATLCLGQLSSHPRLERTIPHKAFEAGYYGTPYVSMKSVAVSEIFPNEKACYFLDDNSPQDIARAINWLLRDSGLVHEYANGIFSDYRLSVSQEKIYLNFIETLSSKGFI